MPSLVIHAAFMFWYFAPLLMTSLEGDGFGRRAVAIAIDNSHATKALAAITTTYFTFLLAFQLRFRRRLGARVARMLGDDEVRQVRLFSALAFAASVLAIGFYVIAAGGPSRALSLILASRSELKPWDHDGYQA